MEPRLYQAAKSGDVNLLRKLVDENPRILLKVTPQGNTALHIAVRFGHKDFVVEVFHRCPQFLTRANLEGDTPLHIAARAVNYFSIADFLITEIFATSIPEDIENRGNEALEILRLGNKNNNTVLHEAVRKNNLGVVKLLANADPQLSCFSNDFGESPLYLAAREGSLKIVNQIVLTSSSSAYGGPNGQTALHVAVIEDHFDIMETLLIEKPQLVKEADAHGRNPLHYAASSGSHKMVQRLLQFDTSIVYLFDKDGLSPIHIAAIEGHTSVIEELIQYCPDCGELLDLNGQNALHLAVKNGNVNVVRYALETIELEELINQADYDGNTPLHLATMDHQSCIMQYLMWDCRVDRRVLNKRGQAAIDIDMSIRELSKPFSKGLVSTVWRQFKSSFQTWDIRKNNMRSSKPQRGKEATATVKAYKEMGQTLLMVVTLITTVTFAAGFTLPGGYNNDGGPDRGMATLVSNPFFRWFVVSDSVAMSASITAAFILFLGSASDKESYVYYFASATVLTYISLQSTATAFSSGVVAAVSPNEFLASTVTQIVSVAFYASTFLPILLMERFFSLTELYQFLLSRLPKVKKFKPTRRNYF